ncbi:protein fem-1 homolog B-like isoform X3 [Varroa destructor]|uniref:Protein fem-1 homolog B n=1 Tax=Varroa destructor TaxID=109461 RepID=A0A7M7KX44_VARDE|nr:protein fem-1 homolog B-like isoform X3 [Varroa destructor]
MFSLNFIVLPTSFFIVTVWQRISCVHDSCHPQQQQQYPHFHEEEQVFCVFLLGLLDQLTSRVAQASTQVGKTRVRELLNRRYQDETQLCAPLLVAAKEGHVEICDLLIYEYHVDMETEGTIVFDGYKIDGATPLWCAAGGNHMTIVMMLIKCGADVNHATGSRSTPLRAACFDGKVEMVKLLLDHKADYNIANKFENTCLMIAAYKGHKEVVTCLLEHGAPVNARALCGNTALQFAAEHGYVEIISELIRFGASVHTVNKNAMTPIITAAERTQPEAVEFFVAHPDYSRETKIDALELLGASFANDKDNYDLERCYHYLRLAMKWRYGDPDRVLPKVLPPPVPAYENRVECRSLEELQQIKYNANALQMESLAIRERILGPLNPEVPHPVTFRGAVFADSANFERCLELWLHALSLKERSGACVVRDLLRFAQVFCQMLHVGVQVSVDVLITVMRTTVTYLEHLAEKEQKEKDGTGNRPKGADEHEIVLTSLYLLVVVSKLSKRCRPEASHTLCTLVYRMTRSRCATNNGNTLLHLAVDSRTPVNDFHTRNLCHFPCANTAKLLMECGGDVNAINEQGDTPLHLIVAYSKPITDFFTLHSIISALIERGAHTDVVNYKGQTPQDAATTGVAELVLRAQSEISLKCIAAKAVHKHGVHYKGRVPRELTSFIEMHGQRTNKPRAGVE